MSEKYQDRIVDQYDVHNHPDHNVPPPIESNFDYSIHSKTEQADDYSSTDARQMMEDRKRAR